MPTILTKRSNTPGAVPATANLTNAAGGAELAVNTADRRLFTINSSSAVVELGTNPSSLTCADASFTLMKAASATITNLTATSIVISNLSIASANITTLTSASATITNLINTSASITTITNSPTFSAGTANGVLYLNGSKVATSGSALTFDGSTLGTTGNIQLENNKYIAFKTNGGSVFYSYYTNTSNNLLINGYNETLFLLNNVEGMRLTSTGLGIGTTSPVVKLQVETASASSDIVGVFRQSTNPAAYIKSGSGYAAFGQGATSGETRIMSDGGGTAFVSFYTGSGTERARIDASGNLGVGTTSPTSLGSGYQSITTNGTNGSGFVIKINGTDASYIYQNSTALQLVNTQATPIYFFTSNTERMRLDSSGNLGIGTSSPKEKLDSRGAAVFSGDNATGTNAFGTASGLLLSTSSDNTKARITAVSNGANSISLVLRSLSSGTAVDAVTIDPSGNLGLGVTPSAWGSSNVAFQIQRGSINSFSNLDLQISQNTYYDGSNNRYIASAFATIYSQLNGTHAWYTAPSGTAGNTITFTQAMTLDASGNLGLGTTSPKSNAGYATFTLNNSTNGGVVQYCQGDTTIGQLYFDGNGGTLRTVSNTSLVFGTNNTERARITAAGNLGVNTTSPDALLSVNGVGSFGAGTAALPSVAQFGDLDTGRWSPAANTLAWSTNGIERARIPSVGGWQFGQPDTSAPSTYAILPYAAKAGIANAGTAVIDIEAVNISTSLFSVGIAEVDIVVAWESSPSTLQGHYRYNYITVNNSTGGGTAAITEMYNGSAGSFVVATGDFAVTRPAARTIRITYTNQSSGNVRIAVRARGMSLSSISVT